MEIRISLAMWADEDRQPIHHLKLTPLISPLLWCFSFTGSVIRGVSWLLFVALIFSSKVNVFALPQLFPKVISLNKHSSTWEKCCLSHLSKYSVILKIPYSSGSLICHWHLIYQRALHIGPPAWNVVAPMAVFSGSCWTRCLFLGRGKVWENILQDTDGPCISPRLLNVRKTLGKLVISFTRVMLPLQLGHISQRHLSGRILAWEPGWGGFGGQVLKDICSPPLPSCVPGWKNLALRRGAKSGERNWGVWGAEVGRPHWRWLLGVTRT